MLWRKLKVAHMAILCKFQVMEFGEGRFCLSWLHCRNALQKAKTGAEGDSDTKSKPRILYQSRLLLQSLNTFFHDLLFSRRRLSSLQEANGRWDHGDHDDADDNE